MYIIFVLKKRYISHCYYTLFIYLYVSKEYIFVGEDEEAEEDPGKELKGT